MFITQYQQKDELPAGRSLTMSTYLPRG